MWYVAEKIEADVKFILSCTQSLNSATKLYKKPTKKSQTKKQKEKLLIPRTNEKQNKKISALLIDK